MVIKLLGYAYIDLPNNFQFRYYTNDAHVNSSCCQSKMEQKNVLYELRRLTLHPRTASTHFRQNHECEIPLRQCQYECNHWVHYIYACLKYTIMVIQQVTTIVIINGQVLVLWILWKVEKSKLWGDYKCFVAFYKDN